MTSTAVAPSRPEGTLDAPLVDVRGLRVQFDDNGRIIDAVDGVDLTLHRGEFVALVGESGSGKTTIARSIIGLLPRAAKIAEGEILFLGRDLLSLDEKQLRKLWGREIGLVPQDPGASLDPVKTIGSQVSEIFRLHRRDFGYSRAEIRQKSIELLELVGIDRPEVRLSQYPYELSGGLKQRVLIAIAFGLNPTLLIADEPTSALDVTVQKQVLEVFDNLVSKFGTTVIFVTHDLAVATDHASRIVVMRGGRIREDKSVSQILAGAEDEYTIRLIREAEPRAIDADAVVTSVVDSPAKSAIEVDGLVREFGPRLGSGTAFRAVDGVSFRVEQGTTLSLVGESGSGKSTTARLVMRLIDPTAGRIRVLGDDVTDVRGARKRQLWRSIQLVYQNPDSALDPRMTVSSIIEQPLKSFGIGSASERRARVRQLVDQVALPEAVLARRPRELSGGQRQRVAIARALSLDAHVLVLDEALSALDVLTQGQILDLLRVLQSELDLTYLFISHDLSVVREISDTVAVMQRGRIVESGPVAAVFGDPQDEYTKALLDANPGRRLEEAVAARKLELLAAR